MKHRVLVASLLRSPAIDLGSRHSQICMRVPGGKIEREKRVETRDKSNCCKTYGAGYTVERERLLQVIDELVSLGGRIAQRDPDRMELLAIAALLLQFL